jgi:glutathione S-transferase
MTRRMATGARPPFAPPFLVHGDVVVAQVAAILLYLGPRLGLAPADEAGRLWCHQIQLTVTDLVAEAHDTHHPVGSGLYYDDQKPEALRRSEEFLAERLPKFLGWLDRVAERNKAAGPYLVGGGLTTADLSTFQVIEGLRYAFPNAMADWVRQYPRLHDLHGVVAQQPAVAAYLASERRIPFNEDGVFRHYPELDR